jgi:hypothetical protein
MANQKHVLEVKKFIKSLEFKFILPEFFHVSLKNTDAGMGGEPVVLISFDKVETSNKRYNDIANTVEALKIKFGNIREYSYPNYCSIAIQ